MKGIVVKSTGSWYTVFYEEDIRIDCKLKGNFKIKDFKTTNPIAVGDIVYFEIEPDKKLGLIYEIEQRRNYIIRKSTKLSKKYHIIASNIDRAVLIVTLAFPRTSTGFIDRFLTTAEAYHIPATIVFNKIDLYETKQKLLHNELIGLYTRLGYECFEVSVLTGKNMNELINFFTNKVCLVAGHSGVGKTELVNKVEPSLNLKVGEISAVHSKGKHTTTFAEMFQLAVGGFIIDTPGIKELGIVDFKKEEVAQRFPEMRELMSQCAFNNCTHIHEPRCAVIEALEAGNIHPERYRNYVNIINNVIEEIEDWR